MCQADALTSVHFLASVWCKVMPPSPSILHECHAACLAGCLAQGNAFHLAPNVKCRGLRPLEEVKSTSIKLQTNNHMGRVM